MIMIIFTQMILIIRIRITTIKENNYSNVDSNNSYNNINNNNTYDNENNNKKNVENNKQSSQCDIKSKANRRKTTSITFF